MATLADSYLLVVVLCGSMLGASLGNRNWQYGWNTPKRGYNCTNTPKKIVVGGSAKWTFGFDYTAWASNNAPFYVNDTLVFKYEVPKDNNTRPHNVYLLPNLRSFLTCNLTKAVKVADESQGAGGEGFEFALKKWQRPYYFACGIADGIHCNLGRMKFSVLPQLRRWHY